MNTTPHDLIISSMFDHHSCPTLHNINTTHSVIRKFFTTSTKVIKHGFQNARNHKILNWKINSTTNGFHLNTTKNDTRKLFKKLHIKEIFDVPMKEGAWVGMEAVAVLSSVLLWLGSGCDGSSGCCGIYGWGGNDWNKCWWGIKSSVVDEEVILKGGRVSSSVRTVWARVRFFSCVNPQVLGEIGTLVGSVGTVRARERPLSRMSPDVELQVTLPLKALATELTVESPWWWGDMLVKVGAGYRQVVVVVVVEGQQPTALWTEGHVNHRVVWCTSLPPTASTSTSTNTKPQLGNIIHIFLL